MRPKPRSLKFFDRNFILNNRIYSPLPFSLELCLFFSFSQLNAHLEYPADNFFRHLIHWPVTHPTRMSVVQDSRSPPYTHRL